MHDGWMHLIFSKGTLVPRAGLPMQSLLAQAEASAQAPQPHREKRAREDGGGGSGGEGPAMGGNGRGPSSSSTGSASSGAHPPEPSSLERLLSAHVQLLQCVHATLLDVEALDVEVLAPAGGNADDGRCPVPLNDGQRAALSALVAPLRRSMAALQDQPLAMGAEEAAAAGGENVIAAGVSIPPSPPCTGNSSTTGSSRGRPPSSSTRSGVAGALPKKPSTPLGHAPLMEEGSEEPPHSTGLFACIDEPVSCLTALLCCPTLLAQLWVRRGLRHSTAAQRRVICLLTTCVLWLFVILLATSITEGWKHMSSRVATSLMAARECRTPYTFTPIPQYMDNAMLLPTPTDEEARWCNASMWCNELRERADEWHDLHYLCNSTSFDAALVAQEGMASKPQVVGTLLIRSGTPLQRYVSTSGGQGVHESSSNSNAVMRFVSYWAALILLGSTIFACSALILCSARRKQKGTRSVLGALADCCAAVWCLPCMLCQLSRLEGLASGNYRMFSSDGRGADILPVST